MTIEELDQIADDATHAAIGVLMQHGLRLNPMQIDELNFTITDLLYRLVVVVDNKNAPPTSSGEEK